MFNVKEIQERIHNEAVAPKTHCMYLIAKIDKMLSESKEFTLTRCAYTAGGIMADIKDSWFDNQEYIIEITPKRKR